MNATPAGSAGGPKPASAGAAQAVVQMLPGWDEDAVAALYQVHYRPLVRQAALLVGDIALAEDVAPTALWPCTARGSGSTPPIGPALSAPVGDQPLPVAASPPGRSRPVPVSHVDA